MTYDFDRVIDRRHSDSTKWHVYGPDVLPLWTADMDFRVAEPVLAALRARVEHGIFGYCYEQPELREVIVERLARLYDRLSERSALIMLAAWRGSTMAVTRAKYRPALYDDERQRARAAPAQTRPAVQPGTGVITRTGSQGSGR